MKRYLACLILLSLVASAGAEESDSTQKKSEWASEIEGSLLLTSGNTSVTTLGLGAKTKYDPGSWVYSANFGFITSKDTGVKQAESVVAGLRTDRKVSDQSSVFAKFGYLQNFFTGYSALYNLDLGYAYDVFKKDDTELSAELALGYQSEKRTDGVNNDFMNGSLAVNYKVKLTSNTTFATRPSFRENFATASDWRLIWENSVSVAMSSMLSLKVNFDINYQNVPVTGKRKTDTATKVAIVANF